MAGAWKGFTEEDIEFYRKFGKEKKGDRSVIGKKPKNLQGLGEKGKSQKYRSIKKNEDFRDKTPEAAKLFNDSEVQNPELGIEKLKGDGIFKNGNGSEEKNAESNSPIIGSTSPVCLKVIEGKAYELVQNNFVEVSKTALEIFETRQKKLEEENKKKKDFLSKIISIRKKQTTEEAMRLQKIQEELQKLDMRLSNDVAILRDKIEEATLNFADAQKRYKKAEKEYLEAKQNLSTKLEKKELLTKYLCTIIEQNELRKSQKLSELMEKLEVNENGKVSEFDCKSALKETIAEALESSVPTQQAS